MAKSQWYRRLTRTGPRHPYEGFRAILMRDECVGVTRCRFNLNVRPGESSENFPHTICGSCGRIGLSGVPHGQTLNRPQRSGAQPWLFYKDWAKSAKGPPRQRRGLCFSFLSPTDGTAFSDSCFRFQCFCAASAHFLRQPKTALLLRGVTTACVVWLVRPLWPVLQAV